MVKPEWFSNKKRKLKEMTETQKNQIAAELKAMLHAHRDELRNQERDSARITFDTNSGYFGEAFGMLRTLAILGYGYFGSSNLHALREREGTDKGATQKYQNLRWWFCELEEEVLKEEGFYTDNKCEHCVDAYGKDDSKYINEMGFSLKTGTRQK